MAYHGQLKITSQKFTLELTDVNSTEHNKLAGDVRRVLENVYKDVYGKQFVNITNILFSNGSVLADYEVQLTDTSSDAEVQTVLANYVNAQNGKLGVLTVIVSSS
ncbi:hypothetical protein NP493_781g02000 [Ridgeia piscesae]|uniref:SEA domain-containing protein n=1 Tax=Ridgeia piscesae TaxID=27915 RepID=A0AAD9KNR2_RIDPI|nr:hypothetical protein NP493_781g02000 [Ridgeia piscesae]